MRSRPDADDRDRLLAACHSGDRSVARDSVADTLTPRLGSGSPSLLRRFLAAVLVAVAASACSGDDSAQHTVPSNPLPARVPNAGDMTAIRPQMLVRVVDGDTGNRVQGAIVRLAEGVGQTDQRGVARIDVDEARATGARISAPGYVARRLSVPYSGGEPVTVQLWRLNLQWPMYGATPARTQAHPAIMLRPPFRIVWSRGMKFLLEFPAVVWEGVAYIANIRGYLAAVSMRNGHVLWRKKVGTTSASSPAVDAARGQLVVATKEPGRILLVAMKTGKIRWRHAIARAEPSPVIVRGVAYFGDESGRVYALDLRRRKMRWTFSGGAKITSSPAIVGQRLYVGDYAGRVFALNARSGRRLWTGSAGTRVYGTVSVAHGRVFAPSVFSGLSALSARTGRLLWRIPVGVYLYSSPAYYRGRVFFGTYAGTVYCVDASSGRILWRRSTGAPVSGAVVVVAGVAYAASFNDRITAWHWRSGRKLWRFPHGRYVPVSGNGGRLLIHGVNRLWAVEPKRRR
jgi:outer membrane protein assembly factor BamB